MAAPLKFLFDENVHGDIVDGFAKRNPTIDAVRAVDVGLRNTPDDVILEWAAANDRIVISIDKRTLPDDARARVRNGLFMPGVLILRISLSIGDAVKELEVAANAGTTEDFSNMVVYLPL